MSDDSSDDEKKDFTNSLIRRMISGDYCLAPHIDKVDIKFDGKLIYQLKKSTVLGLEDSMLAAMMSAGMREEVEQEVDISNDDGLYSAIAAKVVCAAIDMGSEVIRYSEWGVTVCVQVALLVHYLGLSADIATTAVDALPYSVILNEDEIGYAVRVLTLITSIEETSSSGKTPYFVQLKSFYVRSLAALFNSNKVPPPSLALLSVEYLLEAIKYNMKATRKKSDRNNTYAFDKLSVINHLNQLVFWALHHENKTAVQSLQHSDVWELLKRPQNANFPQTIPGDIFTAILDLYKLFRKERVFERLPFLEDNLADVLGCLQLGISAMQSVQIAMLPSPSNESFPTVPHPQIEGYAASILLTDDGNDESRASKKSSSSKKKKRLL